MKKSDKNISKIVKNGTVLSTYDHYLFGADGKSIKKRAVLVIDSNNFDSLALLKFTTSNNVGTVEYGKFGLKRIRVSDVYIKDNAGKFIKLSSNGKFVPNNITKQISFTDANHFKRLALDDKRFGKRNRDRLKELKGRDSKNKHGH